MEKFEYPLQYDEQMISWKHKRDVPKLDKSFAHRAAGAWRRFTRWFMYAILLRFIAWPIVWWGLGAKVKGRKNFKKRKKELKDGCVTICNHVHMWDAVLVLHGIRPNRVYFPTWQKNFVGPFKTHIQVVGGMPIPTSVEGKRKMYLEMHDELAKGGWLHFFPEEGMWWYYDAVRPFKRGAFLFAVDHNKPILPTVVNYRPAKGFRKIFRRGGPYLTLHIGDPIYPDNSIESRHYRIADLLERSREAMHQLGGFTRRIEQTATHRDEADEELLQVTVSKHTRRDLKVGNYINGDDSVANTSARIINSEENYTDSDNNKDIHEVDIS